MQSFRVASPQNFATFSRNPKSPEHLLKYGKQLNDMALELQEWIQIQTNDQVRPMANDSPTRRPLQQLSPTFKKESRSKSRKHSRKLSRSSSKSRSRSKEGAKFIKRIEDLRKNLEIEGKSLQGMYTKNEEE